MEVRGGGRDNHPVRAQQLVPGRVFLVLFDSTGSCPRQVDGNIKDSTDNCQQVV